MDQKILPDSVNVAWETERLWDENYKVTDFTFENTATAGFLCDLRSNIQQILEYFNQRNYHLETTLKQIYRKVSAILKMSPFYNIKTNLVMPKPSLVFRKDPRTRSARVVHDKEIGS